MKKTKISLFIIIFLIASFGAQLAGKMVGRSAGRSLAESTIKTVDQETKSTVKTKNENLYLVTTDRVHYEHPVVSYNLFKEDTVVGLIITIPIEEQWEYIDILKEESISHGRIVKSSESTFFESNNGYEFIIKDGLLWDHINNETYTELVDKELSEQIEKELNS